MKSRRPKRKKKKEYASYGLEFKLAAVKRTINGEKTTAVARELGVHRSVLFRWRKRYRGLGPDRLRGPGRPSREEALKPRQPTSTDRIAELERLAGQQALEVDFLRRAFKRVKELRRQSSTPGGTASTERSGQ
jgi:transposase-like protein